MEKESSYKLKLAEILFLVFIFSLFFPIRHVFLSKSSYILGFYSDFTSVSLYLSDILLIVLWLICFFPHNLGNFWLRIKDKGLWILLIWLILELFWYFRVDSSQNLRYSLKYAELIVAYGTISYLYNTN